MKIVLLLFGLIAFIYLSGIVANYFLHKISNKEGSKLNNLISEPNEIKYREVLNKKNCNSSRKPKDYNDKQNLTKYNHGTYRDEKGRFQSEKKWKKAQETS